MKITDPFLYESDSPILRASANLGITRTAINFAFYVNTYSHKIHPVLTNFKHEMRAALPEGMVGLVGGRRRARPAPGHAATEHPPSHHLAAVRDSERTPTHSQHTPTFAHTLSRYTIRW